MRYLTACPRNCYSTCSFSVEVEENKLIAIYPDRDNRAVPEGPCIKGLSYLERAGSPDRITSPLLRNNDGTFRKISLDEALDILATRLIYYSTNYSPKSVLYYTGSGMSGLTNSIGHNFFRLYGGATTTYGNFCWPAGLEAVRLTLGEVKHNAPWDIENARLIILWGKNPAETNIQEINFIARASAKGARVIVIDPRRTPSADRADIHISPRPGTDAAIALAICKFLVDTDKINHDFIRKHVTGFGEFKESLTISIDDAAAISGVSSDSITELARMIGSGVPTTLIPGFGMQRYTNGGQTIRSLLAINILTGNIGREGCGFNYANLQGYVYDHLKEPLSYYPDINPDPLFRREIPVALLGERMLSMSNPELKMAWIERGNPLTQAPDTSLVEKAFQKLDFVVVIEQFMNDTAAAADLVLPAKNMFEQQDIISSYWSPYIFYRPRVLNPVGDILPESDIYYHLARRMNLEHDDSVIPSPGENNLDNWLSARIEGMTDLTLDDLRKAPCIAPGFEEIAYSDLSFKTPSEKIELLSETAGSKWGVNTLPGYSKAFMRDDRKHKYYFMTPNNRNRIHSQFGNLDIIRENDPFPKVQVSYGDASELDLQNNDEVRIFNDQGEVIVRADVTARIMEGCVSIPNGWWKLEGGGGNMLSKGTETDMGFGTAFHDTMVSLEKVKR